MLKINGQKKTIYLEKKPIYPGMIIQLIEIEEMQHLLIMIV